MARMGSRLSCAQFDECGQCSVVKIAKTFFGHRRDGGGVEFGRESAWRGRQWGARADLVAARTVCRSDVVVVYRT